MLVLLCSAYSTYPNKKPNQYRIEYYPDKSFSLFFPIDPDLEIGTFANYTAIVKGSCCTDHVWLNVSDVAGNSVFCFASINDGLEIQPSHLMIYILLTCLFRIVVE